MSEEFETGDLLHFRDSINGWIVVPGDHVYEVRGLMHNLYSVKEKFGPITHHNGDQYLPLVDDLPVGSVVKDSTHATWAKADDGWLLLRTDGIDRVRGYDSDEDCGAHVFAPTVLVPPLEVLYGG